MGNLQVCAKSPRHSSEVNVQVNEKSFSVERDNLTFIRSGKSSFYIQPACSLSQLDDMLNQSQYNLVLKATDDNEPPQPNMNETNIPSQSTVKSEARVIEDCEMGLLFSDTWSNSYQVFSGTSLKVVAVRRFSVEHQKRYLKERKYLALAYQHFRREIPELRNHRVCFNDEKLEICTDKGVFHLDTLLTNEIFLKSNIFFSKLELVNLLDNVVRQLYVMYQHGIFHDEVKPRNIVYDYDVYSDQKFFRLFDFAVATKHWDRVKSCSPKYFCTSNRTAESIQQNIYRFQTPEDRLRASFYSISFIVIEFMIIRCSKRPADIQGNLSRYLEKPDTIINNLFAPLYPLLLLKIITQMQSEKQYDIRDLVKSIDLLKRSFEPHATTIVQSDQAQEKMHNSDQQQDSSPEKKNIAKVINKKLMQERQLQQYREQNNFIKKLPSQKNSNYMISLGISDEINPRAHHQPSPAQWADKITKEGIGHQPVILEEIFCNELSSMQKIFCPKDKKFYLLKQHSPDAGESGSIQNYINEKDTYCKIAKSNTEASVKLDKTFFASKFDDDKLQIYSNCQICSLQKLIAARQKYQKPWAQRPGQLFKLLLDLYQQVLNLHNINFYHSDISPSNIQVGLALNENQLAFKLSNLENGVWDYKEVIFIQPSYFCNESCKRTGKALMDETYKFARAEDRVRAELFCVAMVVLDVLSSQIVESLDSVNQIRMNYTQMVGRPIILNKLRSVYPQELVDIIEALSNEDYDLAQMGSTIKHNYQLYLSEQPSSNSQNLN